MPADRSLQKYARRLMRLENDVRALSSTPRLGRSSIDDGGAITVNDPVTGNPVVVVGSQHDGSINVTQLNGPPPPQPSAPIVIECPGSLRIQWDGNFLPYAVDPFGDPIPGTGPVAPLDWARVTFHAVVDIDHFDPLDPTQIVGSITQATGGEVTAVLPQGVEHLVIAVAWSGAGKFSDPSPFTLGTPIPMPSQEDLDDALALAEAAGTAAADAQAASAAAAAQALAAGTAADSAGDAALAAQNAANAAQAAADAALGSDDYDALAALAATAQAAAEAAQADADAAAAAATAAGAIAQGAQDSADEKSRIIYSTSTPGSTPNEAGWTWFQRHSTNGRIVSQWRGLGGTDWEQQIIDGLVIANIDAGKITFGTMSGERIEVGSLVIGQVGGLEAELDSKATPAEVASAAAAAEAAAADYAEAQAEAARLAAIATASGDATSKAAAAEAAAIAAAALEAADLADAAYADALAAVDTEYGETKDLVGGWRATGTTKINGGELETDSVLAGSIAAEQVQVRHLAAATADFITVTARDVSAATVSAGLTMTGALTIGTTGSRWNPTEGLVIPGSVVLKPGAAVITAALTATSLTVQKDLLIQGSTNQIKGTLNVANGVTTPTVKPTIAGGWTTVGSREMPFGAIHYGLTPHLTDSTLLLTADAFFGGGISAIVKATGQGYAFPLWSGSKPWQAGYQPFGGIVTLGSNYYLLGADSNRGDTWWVYKLNSTFDKVAEFQFQFYTIFSTYTPTWSGGRPAIGVDNGGNIVVSYSNGSSGVHTHSLNVGTGAWGTIVSGLAYSGIGGTNISYTGAGNYDLGAFRFVNTFENSGTYIWIDGSTRATANEFGRAGDVNVRGMWFDSSTNTFWSFGQDGTLRKHGSNTTAQTVTATYSWFDSNATNGQHESSVSPVSDSFTRPPRTVVTISGELAPDSGITDAGLTDKANQILIYATASGGSRRLQSPTTGNGIDGSGVTIRTITLDTFNTGSRVENSGTVQSFANASNSPGLLQSAGASSSVGWQLDGSGNANFSGIMGGTAFASIEAPNTTGGGGNQTISGTTHVDVTGCTATVTCPGPGAVYEVFFQSWTLQGNGMTQLHYLAVDGTEQSKVAVGIGNASGGAGSYMCYWRISGLSAGSHTFKIRGAMAAAGQTGGWAGGVNTSMMLKRIA